MHSRQVYDSGMWMRVHEEQLFTRGTKLDNFASIETFDGSYGLQLACSADQINNRGVVVSDGACFAGL